MGKPSVPECGLWDWSLLNLIRPPPLPHTPFVSLYANFLDNWSRMQTEREEKGVSGWCKSMTDQLWPLWLLCSPFKQHLPLLYSSYPPDLSEQGLSSVIKYPRSGRNQCRMFTALGQHELMEKLLQTLSLPTGNRVQRLNCITSSCPSLAHLFFLNTQACRESHSQLAK